MANLIVLGNVLARTKLNCDTRIFVDGMPITPEFADAFGEILTAGLTKTFLHDPLGTTPKTSSRSLPPPTRPPVADLSQI